MMTTASSGANEASSGAVARFLQGKGNDVLFLVVRIEIPMDLLKSALLWSRHRFEEIYVLAPAWEGVRIWLQGLLLSPPPGPTLLSPTTLFHHPISSPPSTPEHPAADKTYCRVLMPHVLHCC